MLRNDGRYVFYILEFKTSDGVWRQLSFDASWFDLSVMRDPKNKAMWDDFSSSGQCWQDTGVHGTYELEFAIKLYCLLRENKQNYYTFRVNKKTIDQASDILWCG